VRISSLPSSIKPERNIFPVIGRSEKFVKGPYDPNAGPIFAIIAAEVLNDVTISNPIKDKINEEEQTSRKYIVINTRIL